MKVTPSNQTLILASDYRSAADGSSPSSAHVPRFAGAAAARRTALSNTEATTPPPRRARATSPNASHPARRSTDAGGESSPQPAPARTALAATQNDRRLLQAIVTPINHLAIDAYNRTNYPAFPTTGRIDVLA